jgi:hypothetical protein
MRLALAMRRECVVILPMIRLRLPVRGVSAVPAAVASAVPPGPAGGGAVTAGVLAGQAGAGASDQSTIGTRLCP